MVVFLFNTCITATVFIGGWCNLDNKIIDLTLTKDSCLQIESSFFFVFMDDLALFFLQLLFGGVCSDVLDD